MALLIRKQDKHLSGPVTEMQSSQQNRSQSLRSGSRPSQTCVWSQWLRERKVLHRRKVSLKARVSLPWLWKEAEKKKDDDMFPGDKYLQELLALESLEDTHRVSLGTESPKQPGLQSQHHCGPHLHMPWSLVLSWGLREASRKQPERADVQRRRKRNKIRRHPTKNGPATQTSKTHSEMQG